MKKSVNENKPQASGLGLGLAALFGYSDIACLQILRDRGVITKEEYISLQNRIHNKESK